VLILRLNMVIWCSRLKSIKTVKNVQFGMKIII